MLPNRYSHTLYYQNYKRALEAEKNPEGPAAKEIKAEGFAGQMMGML